MIPCLQTLTERQTISFSRLARHVFSLDSAIEWVAFEQGGHPPRRAWRDSATGDLCSGPAAAYAHAADPSLFMFAEGADGIRVAGIAGNPHRVRLIILAYDDIVQIVARLWPDAYITVAVSPSVDPCALGKQLVRLLDGCSRQPGTGR
jgi:hypothetical protein